MKNFVKIAFVAAIAGYNVYASQTGIAISDLTLNGVDALARDEIVDYGGYELRQEGSCLVCRRDDKSTCNVHDQVPC